MKKFVWLLALLAFIDANAADRQEEKILAPGYGQLDFVPPVAGTYELPTLGFAADGEIVLSSGENTRLHPLFQDHIVLLSFIYASCHDVNGCPLATHVLHRTLKQLQKQPEAAQNLRVISLSFDPQKDTPAMLKVYSSVFVKDFPGWLFATTASEQKLQPILNDYGQNRIQEIDENDQPSGIYAHNLRVFLIDQEKHIRNIYSVGFLHPDVLINDIKTLQLEQQLPDVLQLTSNQSHNSAIHSGPGDDKTDYESSDYTTRSIDLRKRTGSPADLLQFAEQPPLGLPDVSVPEDNPLTKEKIELGRKLFFDRRLSLNNTISCAMCHIPEQGFANNELATAIGFEGRTVRRNAPTLYNTAYLQRLFHDGRENSLEQQVWAPLLAANEMANPSIGVVVQKIRHIADYRELFQQAFDGRGPGMETIGMALASYQRTLNSANSPFDRWYYGKQKDALTEPAQQGFYLFTGKAGCSACHTIGKDYALFTDHRLHNTGLGWFNSMQKEPPTHKVQLAPGVFVDVETDLINAAGEAPPNDLGLYEITQNPDDRWRYRTPSLRNISLTAPYMHNGEFSTLREVIGFYNHGGYAHDLLDPLMQPLHLSQSEQDQLVAFLQSLTGDNVKTLVSDAFAAPVGDPDENDPLRAHFSD